MRVCLKMIDISNEKDGSSSNGTLDEAMDCRHMIREKVEY